jgi:hypothetical protein
MSKFRVLALVIILALLTAMTPACGGTADACEPDTTASASAPRLWVEAALDAVRRDFPAPTVHSRNLWHLSAAMWDAWAAYTPGAEPYFDAPEPTTKPSDRVEAIEEALSFAAQRLLSHRYESAVDGSDSIAQFSELMERLCHDPAAEIEPGSPAEIGMAIADAAIEFGLDDGAGESMQYLDATYEPVNEPLVVTGYGITMNDPNRWQPLELAQRFTQNGQEEGSGVQVFIGSQWGSVTSFALPDADTHGITLDPGPPPLLGGATEPEFKDAALEVVRYADTLGGETGQALIDISPGTRGGNSVGANDGTGHDLNPATGMAYVVNEVPLADYGRAIAEFWADGPDSETPPGHWNTLAIRTSDLMPEDSLRWAGEGPVLNRLEWDLRLFFTLNASLHDAAVATWGSKRAYDYVRPISMIRYLGSLGELPLEAGVVELVTDQTTVSGGRHQGLPVGSTVARTWLGSPRDATSEVSGVGWREALVWLPYQRSTFVSPAFAGYVSGHSAFSRAAADVLTAATGTEFFPNGMFTHFVPAGSLLHEEGPTVDVELQWATYGDAADEAGESRRYGGIHVAADDFAGRVLGAEVATLVWSEAQTYFAD